MGEKKFIRSYRILPEAGYSHWKRLHISFPRIHSNRFPCRVVGNLDDYYIRRQGEWVNEAIQYARKIREVENREPVIEDFKPEFGLYMDNSNIQNYPESIYKSRLGDKYDKWLKEHKAIFNGFDDFLKHTL